MNNAAHLGTLRDSIREFETALLSAGLAHRAVSVYVARARRFVDWRGDNPTSPEALSAELPAYASSLRSLAPATVAAYTDGAARFISWLAGEYEPRGPKIPTDRERKAFMAPRPIEDIVIDAVAHYLRAAGWTAATTSAVSRHHGVDIDATLDGRRLLVEAKGWPAPIYVVGPRAGRRRRHLPYTQARAYFSNALLPTLLNWSESGAEIALALPDKITYRTLVDRSAPSFAALGIGVYFVDIETDPPTVHIELQHRARPEPQRQKTKSAKES